MKVCEFNGSERRFMLIDDDAIFCMIAKHMIKSAGICDQLHICQNPLSALDKLEELKAEDLFPNVILLDINMPELDGWQFLNELGKRIPEFTEKTCVYIVSSSVDKSDLSQAKEHNHISDYIVKPLSVDLLKNVFKVSSI
ncbi:MAG: response regulator [Balneolales bacterium]|nr:response regulator [Balneolales bacterium]